MGAIDLSYGREEGGEVEGQTAGGRETPSTLPLPSFSRKLDLFLLGTGRDAGSVGWEASLIDRQSLSTGVRRDYLCTHVCEHTKTHLCMNMRTHRTRVVRHLRDLSLACTRPHAPTHTHAHTHMDPRLIFLLCFRLPKLTLRPYMNIMWPLWPCDPHQL